jgi:hypothetical protein
MYDEFGDEQHKKSIAYILKKLYNTIFPGESNDTQAESHILY